MTPNQKMWALSRNDLARAVGALGYPEEFADLLAKQLGSPKAIDRLASYIRQADPDSMEMIIDEMLAIRREAQEGYSRWLNSAARMENMEDWEEI